MQFSKIFFAALTAYLLGVTSALDPIKESRSTASLENRDSGVIQDEPFEAPLADRGIELPVAVDDRHKAKVAKRTGRGPGITQRMKSRASTDGIENRYYPDPGGKPNPCDLDPTDPVCPP